jgi:hypothetical protein
MSSALRATVPLALWQPIVASVAVIGSAEE